MTKSCMFDEFIDWLSAIVGWGGSALFYKQIVVLVVSSFFEKSGFAVVDCLLS